ncbi:hypothetical protein [Puia sp.]|jgi:hypothetical protein|uniref:hypothetical protein n=1 Tax=Puia sp. TaxID=2045100 RepID=UPI002F41B3B4
MNRTFTAIIMGLFRRIEDWFSRKQADAAPYSEGEKAIERKRRQDDAGKFTYQEEGFTYAFADGPEFVRWAEIRRIVAYKVDRLTYDDICLDIFWRDWKFTITEDTAGWDRLIAQLRIAFPNIPDDWYGKVGLPAFATNSMVLFERGDKGSD